MRPFRVGVINLPPWVVGEGAGICPDLVRELAAESGIPLSAVPLPFARAKTLLLGGDLQMMFAYETTQLQPQAIGLSPVGEDEVLLVGRPRVRFERLAELKGRTIGHVRGTEYDPAFHADPDIVRYPTTNYEQGLQMLLFERLDAFVLPGAALPYCLKRLKIRREQLGSIQMLTKARVVLYVAQGWREAALPAQLSRACEQLRTRQTLERLVRQYGA